MAGLSSRSRVSAGVTCGQVWLWALASTLIVNRGRYTGSPPSGGTYDSGDLVDPQELGQQLAVELVRLGAALDHGPQPQRVGHQDRAVGCEQVVEPPGVGGRLDHGAEGLKSVN